MTITKNPKTGKIVAHRFALDDLIDASERMVGFCLACGSERECCEPDARKYPCDECGMNQVYGAEELIIMERAKP